MKFCVFHKYKNIGEQSSRTVGIESIPISRTIFKCKKCGNIKYIYNFVGVDGDNINNWSPVIDLSDTLSEARKKKLKRLKNKNG